MVSEAEDVYKTLKSVFQADNQNLFICIDYSLTWGTSWKSY